MLFPSLIALAMASRRPAFVLWNFAWYLILAQVGLRAFGSIWGALPGLYFAIQYSFRAYQRGEGSRVDLRFFQSFGGGPSSGPTPSSGAEPRPAEGGDVIDAEFRREDGGAKVISFKKPST